MRAHEIDYHIYGEEMQYVEIELDPQEVVVAENGNYFWRWKSRPTTRYFW